MKSLLLNQIQIENKIKRLSHQILENNFDETSLVLIGLNQRGNILKNKISSILKTIYNGELIVYSLNSKRNSLKEIEVKEIETIQENTIKNKTVIIFDDVVDSGQSLIYAVSHILKYEPAKIQTLALIDRNHRKFPVKVDYVGFHVATTLHENVVVEFNDENNSSAYLQ